MPRPPAVVGGVTPARVLAAEVLAELRTGKLLDPSFERRAGVLDARDRRWAQELLWGTLRRRSWLDAMLAGRVSGGLARLDADVIDLLRLGAYQLLEMTSVPPYAAIAQTVELAKRRHGIGASKLVNAVLRRLERDRVEGGAGSLTPPIGDDPRDALAVRYSHPRWLVERWADRWPLDEVEALLAANNREAPVVARPWGVSADALRAELADAGVQVTDPAPGAVWARDSLQLGSGASLTELGAFRQGRFHVQDPASTLVTQYADFPAGALIADLCAAPGGKALELSRSASAVLASDRSFARLQRVVANLRRLEVRNVIPMVADARDPAIGPVDGVLLDAPCTGTGTFRRHPDARWRLKPSDMAVLPMLQRQILRAAASLVRPGGLLVYSTCSIEDDENDAPVDGFLAEHPEFTVDPPAAGTVPDAALDGGRLRVLPQRHGVDGAFAVRMRRAG
jgi:16S rRNA (cytosine967-C5)-methyltransferase